MNSAEKMLSRAAANIGSGDLRPTRMVDLIESQHLYSANAQVVKAQDEMLGVFLDSLV